MMTYLRCPKCNTPSGVRNVSAEIERGREGEREREREREREKRES